MYYQGNPEIQSDGVQTLYLMNPNYDNMVLMNSHAPLPQFVGVPLSHDPRQSQGIEAAIPPRFQYNTWGAAVPDQTPRGLSLTLSARHTDFPAPPSDVTTMRTVLIGSKYLKAAQKLLDEVANVSKDRNIDRPAASRIIRENIITDNGESGNKIDQLTTPQRQEIQMKKAKLNSMLDEVEQRHREYQKQMQMVIGSFEQAAGSGSARTYTQLALKTILKQFRCLKSTMSAQLKGLNRSLGEEESTAEKKVKVVDYEVRQQRAMQQLGMMQNNAWKPQRGLPERAVSVLRAWLFEHFLHPYPKDSDKQMLAKQTGLTRSQVSNWFINARVRLWKPMVEEMYQEETKTNLQQTNSENNSTKAGPDRELTSNSIPRHEQNNTTIDPPPTTQSSFQSPTGFAQLITSLNIEKHLKRPRNLMQLDNASTNLLSAEMEIKDREKFNSSPDHGQFTTENYLSMAATNINRYGIGEFNADDQQLAAAGFQGNNFSLTLGLPPAETLEFEFGTRIDSDPINQTGASHPSIAYQILDFQNRKPHPAQLLPDFVA